MKVIALTLALGFLLAACGGGNDDEERTLDLAGKDVPESYVRSQVRIALAEPLAIDILCAPIRGLSDTQAGELMFSLFEEDEETRQTELIETSDAEDQARYGAILQEECKRVESAP